MVKVRLGLVSNLTVRCPGCNLTLTPLNYYSHVDNCKKVDPRDVPCRFCGELEEWCKCPDGDYFDLHAE